MLKNITRKKAIIAIVVITIAALIAAGIFFWQKNNTDTDTVQAREQTVTRGDIISSLSEEGTASVTTQTTGLDLDVTLDDDTHLDLEVKVEEVLVRAGEHVSEGDPLFILDQTSLNKAMNTLNNAYQEAQLKADEASINLTLGTVNAEQTRTESLSDGSVASGVYENTLTEMQNKMTEYEKNLQEGQEDYEKYSELLELYNLRTATRNNMQSLVDYYDEALEALEEFYEDYNEDNADYKASYNNYKNQLESLTEALEKAEAERDAYADSEDAEKYGDAYNTAVDKFDEAIISYVKKKFNLLIGERTAEDIKVRIGSAMPYEDEGTFEIKGRNLVDGLPKNVVLSAAEVREALSDPLQTIVEVVKSTLEKTPPELSADIIDHGIMLTGGGALLRGLDMLISQETGMPVHVAERPLDCVADGTGKRLDINLPSSYYKARR